MYLVNEILDFGIGRRQEARDRLAWIHSLMANKPGFQRALVARYLGDATRHTILRLWDDEAAFVAFRATPDGNYGRGRPEGLYATVPVVPRWNSISEGAGSGEGGHVVKVEVSVPAEAHEAFAAYLEKLTAVASRSGGLASVAHLRASEGDSFLSLWRFNAADDFDRLSESSERVELRKALPEGIPAPVTMRFEVVSEVLPAL